MKNELTQLSITEAAHALRAGDFSSRELTAAYLDCAQKENTHLGAYLEFFSDASARADEVDRIWGGTRYVEAPLLAGIPLALKDNILVVGKHASSGSKILEGYVATYNAHVVSELMRAGAVLIGRTNMDEFAMGSSTENSAYIRTVNPHDTTRVPGGSSGGSAVAVAANLAAGAFGSDTGGSVRQPAAFCGVVGLKPTYGAVSRSGLMAMASSLDQIGPFARTVEDAELLFRAISNYDPKDSTCVPIPLRAAHRPITPPRRIGVPRDFLMRGLDPDVAENFDQSLTKLRAAGYEIVDLTMPYLGHSLAVYYVIMPAEASTNLARYDGVRYGLHVAGDVLIEDYRKTRGVGFGREVRRRILLGTYVLSAGYYDAYYSKAVAVREIIRREFATAFENVDVIVTPTTPAPAFKHGEKTQDPLAMYLEDIFTVPANIAGVPAMSVPSGSVERDGKRLPLGIQFTAPHFAEDSLFTVGKAFEQERGASA